MADYKAKSKIVEVFTFDDLVEYGRNNGANIVNGMPWCFKFHGHGVTHENDQHYLMCSHECGVLDIKPDSLIVRDGRNRIFITDVNSLNNEYEPINEVTDGYHTFNELYIHRHALFINVINAHQDKSFKTHRNDAGEQWEGWFIAGLNSRFGQITYHLPIAYWDSVNATEVDSNSDYDGHSAADVVERLLSLAAE